ncbi:MAG: hypothetical protein GY790_13485 [Bacteroidetes bacterium]|nr:hypothetical protein [Bacteroidota bacterium]
MKRITFLLLNAGLCLSLSGQETVDILSLSGRYGIPQEYTDAAYSGNTAEWGSINSLQAGFNVAEKTMIVFNINHFYFNVPGDPETVFPNVVANPVKINGIMLRAGIRQYFSEGRRIQVMVVPRLMSDFQNMDGSSFQFGGLASYLKKYHDDLSIGFGAIYNSELFGPYVVPFLDLNWKFAEKWRVKGLFPITLRVEYSINDNMITGLNHFGLITTYALGDDAYAGDYMERQSIDLSLFLRQRLAGNFFVEGMVGRALGRQYRQFAGDQKVDFAIPMVAFGDERVAKNDFGAFNDGLILTLKLIYNMPMPE